MDAATYRRILLPLDASKRAEATIPHALAQATAHGAAVHLVQVVDPVEAWPAVDGLAERLQEYQQPPEANLVLDAWSKAAGDYLDSVAAELRAAGVAEVTSFVVQGSPYSVLVDEIRERECDMVVIATHGRSGFGRAVMGSVADHLVRNAGVPVLVIRATEAD